MRLSSIFAALILGLVAASAAEEHEYTVGSIHIVHPWSRETPPGANDAVGYVMIDNKGTTPDRLLGGSAEISGRFQIHEMKTEDGVMKMRELEKGVEIAPGATVKFEPNGYHLMLLDLKTAPVEGKPFMGTLNFEKAGRVEVKFVVRPLGATTGESPKDGAMKMDHSDPMQGMKH